MSCQGSGRVMRFFIYWLSFFMLQLGVWVEHKFETPSFDQILYHFQYGVDGLVDADQSLFLNFLKNVIFAPVVIVFILYFIRHLLARKQYFEAGSKRLQTFWAGRFVVERGSLILLIACAMMLLTKVSFWEHFQQMQYSNFIDKHYVEPVNIREPKEKRNLVLVYVESLEATYSDKEIFGDDLLSSLNESTAGWASFSNFSQTTGTNWTIAGIVSTQCGVPLRPYAGILQRNEVGEKAGVFMPGITCLGDVLRKAGYKNVFLGGASGSFAGKQKFLFKHGYQEIYGREEWKALGESEFNDWGLYDDRLLQRAKKKLDQLAGEDQPFNLTILTVDTHQPAGYISKTCEAQGVTEFSDIVKCSSRLLAEFIDYIKFKGYDKTTDIVIVGDHLATGNPLIDSLKKAPQRKIYNKFYSSRGLYPNRDDMYHFGVYPTILTMLGFKFDGGKLALGVTGFGQIDPKAYSFYMEEAFDRKLGAPSEIYQKFWSGNVKLAQQ